MSAELEQCTLCSNPSSEFDWEIIEFTRSSPTPVEPLMNVSAVPDSDHVCLPGMGTVTSSQEHTLPAGFTTPSADGSKLCDCVDRLDVSWQSLSASETDATKALIELPKETKSASLLMSEHAEGSDTEEDEFQSCLPLRDLVQWMDNRGDAGCLVFPAMEGLRGLYSTRLYAGDADHHFKPVVQQRDWFPIPATNWLVRDVCGGSIGVIVRERSEQWIIIVQGMIDYGARMAVEEFLLTTRLHTYRSGNPACLIGNGDKEIVRLKDELTEVLNEVYYSRVNFQPPYAYEDWFIGLGRLAASVHDGFESKWFSHFLWPSNPNIA